MTLPLDPLKKEEYLKKLKSAAIRRSLDPVWREHVRLARIGKKMSEEIKQKMSEARMGKYTGADNPMFGKPSPNRGKVLSDEICEKMSISHIGLEHSKETKQKMSDSKKGENNPFFGMHHTEEFKQKMTGENNPNYGKHPSEETRKKLREARARRIKKV